MAGGVFGRAIDYEKVRIRRRKWWPLQPRHVTMAPLGHIHFHPHGDAYVDDFGRAPLSGQGLFIHEMTHVWQHQRGIFLPVRRHPFSRYGYRLIAGRPFTAYGIEQQAEIVRHTFLSRKGIAPPPGVSSAALEALIDFT